MRDPSRDLGPRSWLGDALIGLCWAAGQSAGERIGTAVRVRLVVDDVVKFDFERSCLESWRLW